MNVADRNNQAKARVELWGVLPRESTPLADRSVVPKKCPATIKIGPVLSGPTGGHIADQVSKTGRHRDSMTGR